MKNVFIVLLIAAVGAGVYFYFSNRQKASTFTSKQLIVGKWKIDSLTFKKDTSIAGKLLSHLFDSSLSQYEFEFTKDGSILKSYGGKVEDTSYYQLPNKTTLLVSDEKNGDKEKWNINELDSSVMSARDKDSAVFHFTKIKTQIK